MNITILEFIKAFIHERLDANSFAEAYICLFQIERNTNKLDIYTDDIRGVLFGVFMLSDLYNSDSDRADCEFNEERLRENIIQEFERFRIDINSHLYKE